MGRTLAYAVLGCVSLAVLSACSAAPPAAAPTPPHRARVHSPASTRAAHPHDTGPDTPRSVSDAPLARRAARPAPQPCAHHRHGQLVTVSVPAQRMWLCAGTRQVLVSPVTTGRDEAGMRTPTGTFRIQGRNRNSTLTLASGRQYAVKYWIPFQAPDFGFHDSPWQHVPYGTDDYRAHGSHGCVHVPLHAIEFLYDWVRIGAKVRIVG